MSRATANVFWVLLAAGVVCLTGLGVTHLWDDDEALYTTCARDMFERGDWVTPTFNAHLFADKPPLGYWMIIGSFHGWGVGEFAARFPAAICALLTALATYHLGRLLFCQRAALWAGVITTSSVIFAISARAATLDAALTLFTVLAFLAFAWSRLKPSGSAGSAWGLSALAYVFLGLAVLTKGPIGALLPMCAWGLFLLIEQTPADDRTQGTSAWRRVLGWLRRCFTVSNIARAVVRLRPLTGIVVMGMIALPWYLMVNARTDGEFLRRFLGEQNLMRALHPMDAHSGPIFYYVVAILAGFFPWSLFLVPALGQLGRGLGSHPGQQSYRLLLAWISVFVAFWSLVSTKLPHYVLPAYPALALVVGSFIDAWLAAPSTSPRHWGRNAAATLIGVGIAVMVALPIVAAYVCPGEGMVGLVGLIPLAGGGLCLWEFQRQRMERALQIFAVTSVALLVAIFAVAAQRIDRHQIAPRLLADIRQGSAEQPPLCTYRFQRPSLVYYAGCPVPHCPDERALTAALASPNPPWIITSGEFAEELGEHFPGRFTVQARCPKFVKRGEIVVLAPRPGSAQPMTAKRDGDSPR